jgi:hypothetical protein
VRPVRAGIRADLKRTPASGRASSVGTGHDLPQDGLPAGSPLGGRMGRRDVAMT